jgi:hypothetical protein
VKFTPLAFPGLVLYCALLPAGAQTSDQKSPDPSAQPQATQLTPPSTPPGNTPAPATDKIKEGQDKAQDPNSGTSKDRLFFALPNFLTLENAGQVPPLTAKEKFKVVARGSFDYVQIPWYGFLVGVSQLEDSEKSYGLRSGGLREALCSLRWGRHH